eukprot:3687365-Amphidinium_carterae.1
MELRAIRRLPLGAPPALAWSAAVGKGHATARSSKAEQLWSGVACLLMISCMMVCFLARMIGPTRGSPRCLHKVEMLLPTIGHPCGEDLTSRLRWSNMRCTPEQADTCSQEVPQFTGAVHTNVTTLKHIMDCILD